VLDSVRDVLDFFSHGKASIPGYLPCSCACLTYAHLQKPRAPYRSWHSRCLFELTFHRHRQSLLDVNQVIIFGLPDGAQESPIRMYLCGVGLYHV